MLIDARQRCCNKRRMRKLHSVLVEDDGLAHRLLWPSEIQTQPSRDPIIPETGLGQRAGRFAGVRRAPPQKKERKLLGAFVCIAQERDAL